MKKSVKMMIIILVIGGLLLLGLNVMKKEGNSKLKPNVEKTEISEETTGYKLDLRIFGTYEKKNINEIVMVTNFKNTDKEITLSKINGTETVEKKYVVKEDKNYEIIEGELKEVKSVPYTNTDIYLEGVKNITSVKEKGKEKLGEKEYTVYTGKVSKKIMNKMLDATDTNIKVSSDAETEVWLDGDYVYKVYYKADGITLYPSYFGYNKSRQIFIFE